MEDNIDEILIVELFEEIDYSLEFEENETDFEIPTESVILRD